MNEKFYPKKLFAIKHTESSDICNFKKT